jgi:hypothetical protein
VAAGLTPFSRLSRAFGGTKLIIMWERILPAIAPFVLWAGAVAVAGQWGLFSSLSLIAHAAILIAGLILALFLSIRAIMRFKTPSFTEINQRLAFDNGLRPERLLAMRHEVKQPRLKIAKAKAGLAIGDPFAIRFALILAAVFGFLIQGPVPTSRIAHAFVPFVAAEAAQFASIEALVFK